MFRYFGTKGKIIKMYPQPRFPTIIEPFAGAASYAIEHAIGHEVILRDMYADLIAVWHYLQSAPYDEILNLPLPGPHEPIPICEPLGKQRLMEFAFTRGAAYPRNITEIFGITNWKNIALKAALTERWDIAQGDYADMPDIEATWFIDPPYQHNANEYVHNHIDYNRLAAWCMSRRGQVIVCEAEPADWLPFRPLVNLKRQGNVHKQRRYTELIWTND